MPLPADMPASPPRKLKKRCCRAHEKKGKYCKRCPVYWRQHAPPARPSAERG